MKINVVCRKDIIYKNGKSPLSLRFVHQRNSKHVSLGLSVETCYWDSKAQMLTSNCPERATIQSKIDREIEAYNKKIKRLEALDINNDDVRMIDDKMTAIEYVDFSEVTIGTTSGFFNYAFCGGSMTSMDYMGNRTIREVILPPFSYAVIGFLLMVS